MTTLKKLSDLNFSEADVKTLGELFEAFLKKSGVENIKDIPSDSPYSNEDFPKEVWLIK